MWIDLENTEENSDKIGKIWKKKKNKLTSESYRKYGRKVIWIVKWFGKYGRKVGWIVERFGKYEIKVSWIVKWYRK